jgi:hypothetical protein
MGQQGQKDGARFGVGFSSAGENRALVAPLAEELARCCGEQRVLFDRFLEAELARPDLDVYLPRLYRDETELIVVLLLSKQALVRAGVALDPPAHRHPRARADHVAAGWRSGRSLRAGYLVR